MAEYDDDDPGFDDAFRDEPDAKPPLKRFSRPRHGDESGGEPDPGATGEVPRPSATGARRGRGSGGGRRSGRSRGARSSSRGSGGRGTGGAAILQNPKARLGLGVLFAVILILVITLVVRDCQRNQLEDSYTSYLNSVAQIVTKSADQGQELRQVLSNTEGLRPPQLRAAIQEIGKQAQTLVDQAEGLDPPGALSRPHGSLVSLLQYRVTGLNQLASNLPTLLQNDDDDYKARGIAQQMQRFLASDVIYEDSFATPARAAMADDDITGVEVPKLQPFLAKDALATAAGAKSLLPALQRTAPANGDDDGGDAGGNLRGTGLVKTEALPSETRLTPGSVTTVEASENLEWRVSVENGGDFAETNVVVKATFSYPDAPNDGEVREASIPSIQPGEVVSINIPGPTENIDYREQGNLVIEIAAVPQESNTDNNRAEYPVKIAL